ncbi:LapA family protein, partial [Cribrihabitans sp. XS_ASV171]
LKLMPDDLAQLLGFNLSIALPLFLVVLGGIAVGLIVGFIWEWMREYKHRKRADTRQREVRKLEREVKTLKRKQHEGKDEVLAILDEKSA